MTYLFGAFELNPERYELLADGEPIALEPRVLEVLNYLVANRDRTVTKRELLDAVWEGDFVSESALTRAIRELRRALGDAAGDPEFVKTIYGRGYLFIGNAKEVDPDAGRRGRERGGSLGSAPRGAVLGAQVPVWPILGSPFVGRRPEIERLVRAFERAHGGSGGLVMLAGGPGIGKSRTAQVLVAEVEERGGMALWGRSFEGWRAPPYWPWVTVIRSYVERVDAETLRTEMGIGAGEIAEIVPEVREVLADVDAAPNLEDAEQARFRLFDSIGRFLRRASRRHPIVIVLDNLHWSDKPSLLLLEMLAHELAATRLLVVGTYREVELSRHHPLSDTLGALAQDELVDRIRLRGLNKAEVAEYIGRSIPGFDGTIPSGPLVEIVHRHTEGNPFFVSEVVRLLIDEGHLSSVEEIGRWDPRQAKIGVPEGVQQVVGRRLNHLTTECNRALAMAAIIGRIFELAVLECMCEGSSTEEIQECLDEAVAAGIVAEIGSAPGVYQFCHALIRETLYDELSTGRRAREHRRAAECLETLHRGSDDRELPQLAHHFFEGAAAGRAVVAVMYCEQAAHRAVELLADEEAIWFFRRALDAMELVESTDEVQRCRLLLALGKALRRTGEMSQAISTFLSAAALARSIDSAEALAEAALGVQFALFAEPAVELLEEALEALPEEDDALRVRVLSDLALAYFLARNVERGEALSREALAMARRVGDPSALYGALRASIPTFDTLSAVVETMDSARAAEHWLATSEEMLALSEQLGETAALVDVHGYRVHVFLGYGDAEAIRTEVDGYRRRAARLRQPIYGYLEPVHRATLVTSQGGFDEAEVLAIEARASGDRIRFANTAGVFGLQMFTLRRLQGRLGEVAGVVEHFVKTRSGGAVWRPGLALVYSELGELDRAREVYEPFAASAFAEIPRDALWTTALVYLVEVTVELDSPAGAETLYGLLLPHGGAAPSAGGIAYLGAMARYLGELAVLLELWDEAEAHFEDALEVDRRLGAAPWVAMTEASYARMLAQRGRVGDSRRAVGLRHSAVASAERLGMAVLERRARDLA